MFLRLTEWLRPKHPSDIARPWAAMSPPQLTPTASTVTPAFVQESVAPLSPEEAMAALDQLWRGGATASTREVPPGTRLWHSGTATRATLAADRPMWFSGDETRKTDYDASARSDATYAARHAFHLYGVTVRELRLADFACRSTRAFAIQHCNADHTVMAQALAHWAKMHGLDGIVAMNGAADEHFLIAPTNDVRIVSEHPL